MTKYIYLADGGGLPSTILGLILFMRMAFERRLALLVEKKRLTVVGRGRGCRYLQPATLDIDSARHDLRADKVEAEIYVPTSTEGEVIKQAVREPIQKRHPVGYNRAFLDDYRPNDTFYLCTGNSAAST